MKITFIVQDDFKGYLEKYNISFEEIDVEMLADGTYNANYNAFCNKELKAFILNFFISAYAPTIVAPLNNAIIDFVTSENEKIEIQTEEEHYTITPENVYEIVPILEIDLNAVTNNDNNDNIFGKR